MQKATRCGGQRLGEAATRPGRPGPPVGQAGRTLPYSLEEEHGPATPWLCSSRFQNGVDKRLEVQLPSCGHRYRSWDVACVVTSNAMQEGRPCTTYVFNISLKTLLKLMVIVLKGCASLRPTGRAEAACRRPSGHHGRAVGRPVAGQQCWEGTWRAGHARPPGRQPTTQELLGLPPGKARAVVPTLPANTPPQGTRRPGSGPPLRSLPFVGFSRTAAERVGNATTEKSLIPELKPSFDHMVLKNSK